MWLAALVLALMGACASAEPEVDLDLVVSWSESSEDWVADARSVPTTLVVTDADREAWLGTLPDAVGNDDVATLRAVDLEEVFLVIGGYPRCMEHSTVRVDPETGEVRFEVFIPEEDEGTMCAWSPYTIDVWAVPVGATDGHPPVLVSDG